jgi:hypothetical protein
MDAQLQRACVARLEEPVFCPSGLTSLIPHYDFGNSFEVRVDNVRNDESSTNEPQEQDGDPSIFQRDVSAVSNVPRPQDFVAAQSLPSYDSQHLHHPRPESHEIAQEEDGRRTRFALEDPDEYADIIQRILHLTSRPDAPDWHVQDFNVHPGTEPELSTGRQTSYASSSTTGVPAFYAYDTEDDALAVDDPRRNYDFQDFMHSQVRDDSSCKHDMVSDLDLSSLLPTSSDIVTRSSLDTGDFDIQGLRWSSFGLSRGQIVGSRRAQHPSSRSRISHRMSANVDMAATAETQYRFRSFSQQHRAHYSHYQLRNVLAAVNRGAIFYATGSKVMQTGLSCPDNERTIMDLTKNAPSPSGVRITCLSAGTAPRYRSYRTDNVLLAGGFGGEYAMMDLNAPRDSGFHSGFVTHDYNGLVTHIDSYPHRRSGQLQACFCSNDRKVRIMDVKTNRFTDAFSYDNAVNCSALSPDKRLRVLVGDSHDTLITDADKGNILVTLKEHNDHGFACAWAEDGTHVATGAQDKRVILWDARNWSWPLRVIPCGMATARSLHFTDDGALVLGEDDDVVTIYHTKRTEVRQDIRFFGSVAGVALLDGGDEMVIANADKTVGGLLSFQRNLDGLNGGATDERIVDGSEAARRPHSPSYRFRRRCEFVSGLIV